MNQSINSYYNNKIIKLIDFVEKAYPNYSNVNSKIIIYNFNDFVNIYQEIDLKYLINYRDKRDNLYGYTLLHIFCLYGAKKEVEYLIENGHSIDSFDSSISLVTPLFVAINQQNLSVIQLLIEKGSNIFVLDINNENALHYAARRNNARIIKLIVQKSHLTHADVIKLSDIQNIKKKYASDICTNQLCKDILNDYKIFGYHKTKKHNNASLASTLNSSVNV